MGLFFFWNHAIVTKAKANLPFIIKNSYLFDCTKVKSPHPLSNTDIFSYDVSIYVWIITQPFSKVST